MVLVVVISSSCVNGSFYEMIAYILSKLNEQGVLTRTFNVNIANGDNGKNSRAFTSNFFQTFCQ